MSDNSISKIYQFLSKQFDWKTEADKNKDGTLTRAETYTFLFNNADKWNGEGENTKDLIYKFWSTIDTEVTGKIKEGSKINNKNALSDSEMANFERNVKISQQVDAFMAKVTVPNVIKNIGKDSEWISEVKDGILEKAFNYVTKNNCELTEDNIQLFYEQTYRKSTASFYANNIKDNIAKDLNLLDENGKPIYKSGSDEILTKLINNYVNSLEGDTTTSIEDIISAVDKLIEAYKDTAITNSKTDELKNHGYNPTGPLNDLQTTVLTKDITKIITDYVKTNYSDLYTGDKYIAAADATIAQYVEEYLSERNASEFNTLKNFDISKIDTEKLITDIKNAQAGTRAADDAASKAANQKLFGALANSINDISGNEQIMNKIYNNTTWIHTEFGMNANGEIVFEQQETSDVYDKLVSNVLYELQQKCPEEYEKLGKDKIKKLIQSAWITTYNTWNSNSSWATKTFVGEVFENLKKILSAVVEKPEYLSIYTDRTAYANSNLTTGLEYYGTKTTDGRDSQWWYSHSGDYANVSSDGLPNWNDTKDAGEYQKTMNALLERIKNAEPYKSLNNNELIEKIFREAQNAALKTCSGNINDCPYGTTNDVDGDIADISRSPIATPNQDWSGLSREDDDWIISPKAIVELTLYYFDKLLYKELLS